MTATLTSTLPSAVVGRTELYLADADPQSANEIVNAVQNFYRDFPLVAPHLADVKLERTPLDSYAKTKTEADSRFRPDPPYRIGVNPDYFGAGNRDELLYWVGRDFNGGFHRYPNPSGVIEHELGHVIDMFLSYDRGLSDRSVSSLLITNPADALSVSGYGLEGGPMETFADAFANWREGLNPGNDTITDALRAVVTEAGGRYV